MSILAEIKNKVLLFVSEKNNLNFAEEIINYEYHFFGNYLNNKKIMQFIKNNSRIDRLKYVITCCNENPISKKEQFLLALAYNRLPKKYTEYALKYLNLYLSDNKYYYKQFNYQMSKEDSLSYQWYIFHKFLAIKYDDNLMFDKALQCIDIALHTNKKVWKYYDEPYELYAEILYHTNNIKSSIQILERGIRETNNKYNKKRYTELIKKYNNLMIKNHIYKPNGRKRIRIDNNSRILYNLTTGEIIN